MLFTICIQQPNISQNCHIIDRIYYSQVQVYDLWKIINGDICQYPKSVQPHAFDEDLDIIKLSHFGGMSNALSFLSQTFCSPNCNILDHLMY